MAGQLLSIIYIGEVRPQVKTYSYYRTFLLIILL
jgi:hypothetical protein